ncbi:MAG: hypothetical protein KDC34_08735 [Saprospiraceae bacterium]|nr:hypothetical protein [Saprospiraceae bacterium]
MQRFFFFLLLFSLTSTLVADPLEDMTFEEAQQVVNHILLDPYILDYCDCCDDAAGYLIEIKELSIEPAEFGHRPYRVRAKGVYLYQLSANGDDTFQLLETEQRGYDDIIWTNYTFTFDPSDRKAHPVGEVLGFRREGNCNPDAQFPGPDQISLDKINRDYQQWYKTEIGYPSSEMDLGSISANPNALAVAENELPRGIRFHGAFTNAVKWKESNGLHYVIVSEVLDPEADKNAMFVCHWLHQGRSTILLWSIRDFAKSGGRVQFDDRSLQLLDIDADQQLETCFFYSIREQDPTQNQLKLMLHDGAEKLALRGNLTPGNANFDPAFDNKPDLFRHFADFQWQRYLKEGEAAWFDEILFRNDQTVLVRQEYLFASGGYSYQLFTPDFTPSLSDPKQQELISLAEEVSLFPDESGLLIFSLPYIMYFDLRTGALSELMQVFPNSGGISGATWAADGVKCAFVVFNPEDYPLATRLFVLELNGAEVIQKEKYDIPVQYYAASVMVVSTVRFLDSNRIAYPVHADDFQSTKQEILMLE